MRSYMERNMSWNLRMLSYMIKEAREVIFYRYRTARVLDIIMEFEDYESSNNVKFIKLENALYKKAGIKRKDNHVCFEVITQNGNKLYFMLSDLNLYIGLGLTVKDW